MSETEAEAPVEELKHLDVGSALILKYRETGEHRKINDEDYNCIEITVNPPGSQSPHAFVFLGEGNFTFSTAFAAHRGSWLGVVPTTLYSPDELKEADKTSDKESIKEWCSSLKTCCLRAGTEYSQSLMLDWLVESLTTEKSPPIRRHLDATSMGDREKFKANLGITGDPVITLWFQCPWNDDYSRNHLGGQKAFLSDFLRSAELVQKPGEYLLIGVYIGDRDPDGNLVRQQYGELMQIASQQNYKCLGADQTFVGEMLKLGYEHIKSDGTVSMRLDVDKADFVVLLFQRMQQ